MHVVVLGAGLAGLSAARELVLQGHLVTVIEREARVGGLARSWRRDGHWLDLGPRPFRAADDEQFTTVNRLLPCALAEHEPRARVRFGGVSLDARPNLIELARRLPAHAFARAAWDLGLARARTLFGAPSAGDLEEWCTRRFGRALHELVTAPLALATTGLDAALLEPPKGSVHDETEPFHYPARGGIGSIARALARDLEARGVDLRLCASFVRLEGGEGRGRRVVWEREGVERQLACDAVVSTIPITELARGLDTVTNGSVLRAADELAHVAMLYVYVEIATDRVLDGHWVLLPEAHLRVHRVSEPRQLAPLDVPNGRTVLCCEIPCRHGDPWWRMDPRAVARGATEDLALAGVLPRGRGRVIDFARARFAEPVRALGSGERIRELRRVIERDSDVVTTGRQGGFEHDDLGATMAAGAEAARELVQRVVRIRSCATASTRRGP